MRGSEEAYLAGQAVGGLVLGEDGGCERAGGAFSFGAGYVDYVEAGEVAVLN